MTGFLGVNIAINLTFMIRRRVLVKRIASIGKDSILNIVVRSEVEADSNLQMARCLVYILDLAITWIVAVVTNSQVILK